MAQTEQKPQRRYAVIDWYTGLKYDVDDLKDVEWQSRYGPVPMPGAVRPADEGLAALSRAVAEMSRVVLEYCRRSTR